MDKIRAPTKGVAIHRIEFKGRNDTLKKELREVYEEIEQWESKMRDLIEENDMIQVNAQNIILAYEKYKEKLV